MADLDKLKAEFEFPDSGNVFSVPEKEFLKNLCFKLEENGEKDWDGQRILDAVPKFASAGNQVAIDLQESLQNEDIGNETTQAVLDGVDAFKKFFQSAENPLLIIDDFFQNQIDEIYDQVAAKKNGEKPDWEDVLDFLRRENRDDLIAKLEQNKSEVESGWNKFQLARALDFNKAENQAISDFLDQMEKDDLALFDDPEKAIKNYQTANPQFAGEKKANYFRNQLNLRAEKIRAEQNENFRAKTQKLPDNEIADAMNQSFAAEKSIAKRAQYLAEIEPKISEYAPLLQKIPALETQILSGTDPHFPDIRAQFFAAQNDYARGKKNYNETFYSPKKYFESLQKIQSDLQAKEKSREKEIQNALQSIAQKKLADLPDDLKGQKFSAAEFKAHLKSKNFYALPPPVAADPKIHAAARTRTASLFLEWKMQEEAAEKAFVDSAIAKISAADLPKNLADDLDFSAFLTALKPSFRLESAENAHPIIALAAKSRAQQLFENYQTIQQQKKEQEAVQAQKTADEEKAQKEDLEAQEKEKNLNQKIDDFAAAALRDPQKFENYEDFESAFLESAKDQKTLFQSDEKFAKTLKKVWTPVDKLAQKQKEIQSKTAEKEKKEFTRSAQKFANIDQSFQNFADFQREFFAVHPEFIPFKKQNVDDLRLIFDASQKKKPAPEKKKKSKKELDSENPENPPKKQAEKEVPPEPKPDQNPEKSEKDSDLFAPPENFPCRSQIDWKTFCSRVRPARRTRALERFSQLHSRTELGTQRVLQRFGGVLAPFLLESLSAISADQMALLPTALRNAESKGSERNRAASWVLTFCETIGFGVLSREVPSAFSRLKSDFPTYFGRNLEPKSDEKEDDFENLQNKKPEKQTPKKVLDWVADPEKSDEKEVENKLESTEEISVVSAKTADAAAETLDQNRVQMQENQTEISSQISQILPEEDLEKTDLKYEKPRPKKDLSDEKEPEKETDLDENIDPTPQNSDEKSTENVSDLSEIPDENEEEILPEIEEDLEAEIDEEADLDAENDLSEEDEVEPENDLEADPEISVDDEVDEAESSDFWAQWSERKRQDLQRILESDLDEAASENDTEIDAEFLRRMRERIAARPKENPESVDEDAGQKFYAEFDSESHQKGDFLQLGQLLQRLKNYALYTFELELRVICPPKLARTEMRGVDARKIFNAVAMQLHQRPKIKKASLRAEKQTIFFQLDSQNFKYHWRRFKS